ncbi:aldose epimerase family protein [Paraglaciecola sp.]|uniref:aldose epimerase family protein n=1 Tax=Paraglaciecola sp. TaxID=1920173 RepID=UPI0030F47595
MITQQTFGHMANGQEVMQFSLTNAQGMSIDILSLGGIIRRWLVADKSGTPVDIVLGFDTLEDYLADQAYLGTVVGRYANRIKHGKFSLQDTDYQVDVNQGGNSLHGGSDGFHHRVWTATILNQGDETSLALELISEDGDQGFPGRLTAKVIYTLDAHNTLKIEYFASSDATTLFNPTQHSYFNLAGHQSGSIASHKVQILASHFTPTDANAIPNGELAQVADTPFDLRTLTPLTKGLAATAHHQINYGNGYDHNWCLDGFTANLQQPFFAAMAQDTQSGRTLIVNTTMPGIQLYTANYLGALPIGKDGVAYQGNGALCLETQFYPDSPNQAHFPSAVLEKDKPFYSVTEYQVIL